MGERKPILSPDNTSLENNNNHIKDRNNIQFEPSYTWYSYQEVYSRCLDFGAGLYQLLSSTSSNGVGTTPTERTFVGISSTNRLDFFVADFGCQLFNMVVVPINTKLATDDIQYIINNAKVFYSIPKSIRSFFSLPDSLRL